MSRKDELLAEIKEINRKEREEEVKKHFHKFEPFIGKYYKLNDQDSSDWWRYMKINSFDKNTISDFQDELSCEANVTIFENDCGNDLQVMLNGTMYLSPFEDDSYIEITKEEFIAKWDEVVAQTDKVIKE